MERSFHTVFQAGLSEQGIVFRADGCVQEGSRCFCAVCGGNLPDVGEIKVKEKEPVIQPVPFNSFSILRFLVEERGFSLISHFSVVDDLLCATDEEYAALRQGFVELAENVVLCFLGEINQHVPADNHIAL